MLKNILLVGAGGFIGSVLRFITGLTVARLMPGSFPWGTFSVNIVGCFVMGLVIGAVPKDSEWRLLLATGLCGGFTTFSAFASESLELLNNGNQNLFIVYTLSSLIIGIAALGGGLAAVRLFIN